MGKFSDLLVPGYNSSRPETWASTKDKWRKDFELIKLQKEEQIMATSDNAEEVPPSLEELAAEFTLRVNGATDLPLFMLTEPVQITVKKSDGGFSKRPQIGGEDFKVTGAYAGKRNGLIFTFKPDTVTDFETMEMSEKDAKGLLSGFETWFASFPDMTLAIKEAKKVAADTVEREKNVSKFEQYADMGFGSF